MSIILICKRLDWEVPLPSLSCTCLMTNLSLQTDRHQWSHAPKVKIFAVFSLFLSDLCDDKHKTDLNVMSVY